ncbi:MULTISPECIES: outer membrane beta-barrel protein [unclassified Sphingobacterium]|uniref:outer membrane beta-barrel protein n=1 Tax=unclassified Sphingobacterium TaxID=2609468 RepID=UPI0025D6014F|nr:MULTISPECIES: outer membrane beta-barrel protein [unclassified Sphingobacterium]
MPVNKRKKIVFAIAVIFGLLPTTKTFAQFGMSIRAGGNLSSTNGSAFHSNKKIGFQIGGDLTYHFDKNIALQAEPAYNLIRIRNNDQTAQRAHGIGAGTRKLAYMSVPLYLKLNFTRTIAILGGLDFNFLLNDDRYKLNNGENAFRSRPRTGYSLGAELGGLYFRYRKFNRTNNIIDNWTADIEQYQLGFKFELF